MNRPRHLLQPVFASQAIMTILLALGLFSATACQDGEETAAARSDHPERQEADTAANATGRYIMEAVWTPRIDQSEDDLD
jgi:hypothetical protein